MNLEFLKLLALSGGDWVIYLLLASSALAAAVIVERAVVFKRELDSLHSLKSSLEAQLKNGDKTALREAAFKAQGAAGRIIAASLGGVGRQAADDLFAAAIIDERRFLESRLLILGSLGSNAPFIGLFGTVLGVIKAFHDLAAHAGAGPEIVMAGLSEALIATAVGLVVAIPSVLAYNSFQKKTSDLVSGAESLLRRILAAGL